LVGTGYFDKVLSPVYTIQPVFKPIVKPDRPPVVSCIQTFNRLLNRVVQPFWQPVEWCKRGIRGQLHRYACRPTAVCRL